MVGLSVGDRLDIVREKILKACVKAGRKPESVNLLAVSKLQDIHKIREAYEHGQKHFAENYIQEALIKIDQLQNLPVRWHFIGRIQSNKVKYMPGHFSMIHSIDRASTADAINRLAAKQGIIERQSIFLQYNVANEASKAGADEIEIENLVNFMSQLDHIKAVGLMVMPPLELDSENVRPYFAKAREFLERVRSGLSKEALSLHPMDQLSMGTSHDFEVAIEEGATWVRIGSEIFGPRDSEGVLQ